MGRGVVEKHYREAHPERYAEKAGKWDILEKTSKGILTENYYKMKTRAESAEAGVKTLKEQLKISEGLINQYSIEEAQQRRRAADAEARLHAVENFLEDLKHRPYVPPWLITGLNSALCDGEAAVKEVSA